MNTRKIIALILCSSMILSAAGCSEQAATDTSDTTITTDSTATESTMETNTETTIETGYVRTIPGIEPEMMTVDYWLANAVSQGFDLDEVIMSDAQIGSFNRNNRVQIKTSDDMEMPFLDEFGDTLDGEILRHLLAEYEAQIPEDPSAYYLNGQPTTAEYWRGLAVLANIDGIEDTIQVRYGFTVKRSTSRLFPTDDRALEGPEDQFFDKNIFSECMPYVPVVILHESSDGEYYYAVFDSFGGWVRKDVIALCTDRDDWIARQNPDQVLTVTARELRLGDDPYFEDARDLVLPMGTHMELVRADDAPAVINQRRTFGDYVVKVPARSDNGYIRDEYVLIPSSDDVTVGYLPYTIGNTIRQALKFSGDRYGWAGDLRANDCTGIIREMYNCFGINMPRGKQSEVTGVNTVDMSEMTDADKLSTIAELNPGSLLFFPGHAMIYLGTRGGVPYVISAVGSFVEPAPGSEDRIRANGGIINNLYVRRVSLVTWLEAIKTAVTIK